MGTVIYTATPLRAFAGAIFLVVLLLGLGLFSAISAIFTRKERTLMRFGTGCAGIILLLAGVGSTVATFLTYQNGDKTVLVQVHEKNVVTSNCNDTQCTDYVAETGDGQKLYDFSLGKDAWGKVEVNTCYQFTYYPAQSLFGRYLQQNNGQSNLYETTGSITRIEKATCPKG
jgi:hypothetical protein